MNLFVPKSIQDRNIEYMKASDDILQFMETNFEKTDDKTDYVKFKEVFQQYKFIVYKKASMKEVREKIESNDFIDYFSEKQINGKKLKSIITGYKTVEYDGEDGGGFKPSNPKYAGL